MYIIITLALMIAAMFLIYAAVGSGGNLGGFMGNLSAAQIGVYAQKAGFSGPDLVNAIAIALAESGGNPTAYNKEAQDVPGRYNRASADDGLGSYGLFQIYLAAHPEFSGDDLNDPQTNANDAYIIFSSGGFGAWSTFKNGAYSTHLDAATQAVTG